MAPYRFTLCRSRGRRRAWARGRQNGRLVLTGRASDAVEVITSGIAAHRSMGSTTWLPLHLSHLAKAYSELGQFDNAWSCIGEAKTSIETTNERWCEAEMYRIAGEIALKSLLLAAANRALLPSLSDPNETKPSAFSCRCAFRTAAFAGLASALLLLPAGAQTRGGTLAIGIESR